MKQSTSRKYIKKPWHNKRWCNCVFTILMAWILNLQIAYAESVLVDDASNNVVTIVNQTVTSTVYGGQTTSGTANSNVVNISGNDTKIIGYNYIYGGTAIKGEASNNTVNVSGGTINNYIHVGDVVNGTVSNNTLNISGGTFNGGWVSGAYIGTDGTASNNVVNITGGNLNVDYIEGSWGAGTHTNNHVNISGGTINGGIISGAWVTSATTASKNTVNISGGKIANAKIAGAYFAGADGNATGNAVTISGSPTIANSEIYGGWSPSGSANNNEINIYDNPNLETSTLYAGLADDGGSASGNKLNIYTKGITAKNIYGFEELNFYMPSSTSAGDTLLTLTNGTTDLSNTSVWATAAGASNLSEGDTVILLNNDNGITVNNTNTFNRLQKGVTEIFDVSVAKRGETQLVATLGAASMNPKTQILAESYSTIPRMFDYESDLIHIQEHEKAREDDEKEWTVLFDMGGRWLRSDGGLGAHADSNVFASNLGMARNLQNKNGNLFVAPLIDYGNSSYDNFLGDGTKGEGSGKYWAGGAVARQTNTNGFYFGGSFRMGKISADFSSDDLIMGTEKTHVAYDTSSRYWAGHVDCGRLLQLGQDDTLDIYGIYFHSHLNSMDAPLTTGETYHFDSIDNRRLRIGSRLTHSINENQKFYAGLAYQYEDHGEARATYKTYVAPTEAVRGSSAMLELGWQIKPTQKSPVMLHVSATGWAGMHKGFSVQAKFEKAF